MTGNPDAIIVGAGPAGLACAMTMRAAGLNVTVLEKAETVGSVWRRHYDRLHLHTDRNHSGLPGMAMPPIYPTYPSREQVVEYLESYTARFNIKPVFNATVRSIRRDGTQWRADAAPGLDFCACCGRGNGHSRCAISSFLAGLGTTSRPCHPQQRISQSDAVCRKARAGRRIRQFGRGDRFGSGQRQTSMLVLPSAARFRFCRATSWAFRFWHGLSCTGACPRASSI